MERERVNGKLRFVNAEENEKLLPPEGNDDFSGLRVSSLNAQFFDSNPAVATASFVASESLSGEELAPFQAWLNQDPETVLSTHEEKR